jgi:hypothetical protein
MRAGAKNMMKLSKNLRDLFGVLFGVEPKNAPKNAEPLARKKGSG